MIGIRCEFNDLDQLTNYLGIGNAIDSPLLLIHAEPGNPILTKLQQLVRTLTKISTPSCELS